MTKTGEGDMSRLSKLLVVVFLMCETAHGGENPLAWARFEPGARTFETLTGLKVSQEEVVDTERFSPGAVLIRLPDGDPGTIRGGILLGRRQGKQLSWMKVEEYAIGVSSSDILEVAIFPYKGWERGVDYGIRLTDTVKNTKGKPLLEEFTWLIAIEEKPNVPPSPGYDPVKTVRFDAHATSLRSQSGNRINQQLVKGRLPGVLYVSLKDISLTTIANSVELGRLVNGRPVWLQRKEYSVGTSGHSNPLLAMFPNDGWFAGSEYVFRLRDTAKDSDGVSFDGSWSVEIPEFNAAEPIRTETLPSTNTPVGRFPGGQNLMFQGAWTDPVTAMAYRRDRWYDPRNVGFLREDSLGDIDGPNLYKPFNWNPTMHIDPLGLTSRGHIEDKIIYYTWYFGWVDTYHAVDNYPSLGSAWTKLQKASSAQDVQFTLEMDQGSPGGLGYKQSRVSFSVTAAESMQGRKRQLLHAWQSLCVDFETYQGEGPQGSQTFTSLFGALKGEEEKIASSFSTEDLFSDLLAFYATVEGTTIENLVQEYGGPIDKGERKEFSLYVWDHLLKPRKEGQRDWAPVYLDSQTLPTPDDLLEEMLQSVPFRDRPDGRTRAYLKGKFTEELLRVKELLEKYEEKYGEPNVADELQLEPLEEGVTVVDVEHK